jgi:anti-anti-sigma regulatory factor
MMIATEKSNVFTRHEDRTLQDDELLAFTQQVAEQSQVSGRSEVEIDFSEFHSLGSGLVNALIRHSLTLRDQNRELVLTKVQPSVVQALRLLRLDRSFRFVEICQENGQSCQANVHAPEEERSILSFVLNSFSRRREQRRVHLRELHSLD